MEFIRLNNIDECAEPLADRLTEELEAGKKVLWMVSGGSNIPVAVAAMEQIPDDLTEHLSVCLVDERYGLVGHADSNGKQLDDAGFKHKKARVSYVLAPGLNIQETTEQFALELRTSFEAADIVIAQLGMGPDGHVLGILPDSPAVESEELVVHYVADDYKRITPTVKCALEHIYAAYVFSFGAGKHAQLEKLRDADLPVATQPAQLLKHLPEAYVYNDLIAS
jgi:6-phosphogluconolactonase/glucosamine-6-phosphate isomerase/deaminase